MGRLLTVFSQNLQRFRNDSGLSQEALAKLTGMARNTIARYESGESPPSFEAIEKLAEALGLDETTLLTDPEVISIWEAHLKHLRGVLDQINEDLGTQTEGRSPKTVVTNPDPLQSKTRPYYPNLIHSKKSPFADRLRTNKKPK